MLQRAKDPSRPFDVIVIHSFSRFFRDSVEAEFAIRKLRKVGVDLISATQPVGADPATDLTRRIIAIFDEHQSIENAKNVTRSMAENFRQGFWNGTTPPLGFRTREVERRGDKIKRILVIDAAEADIVREIFDLYTNGNPDTGCSMGVKAMCNWLNAKGYRMRKGSLFGVSSVHKILQNRIYIGENRWNVRSGKTKTEKAQSEQIIHQVEAIIDVATFIKAQQLLSHRNPKMTPPRVTTSPTLLTGLAFCCDCNGAMTVTTGTSKSGRVYKYYSCSSKNRQGTLGCKGNRLRCDALDEAVTGAVQQRIIEPTHLKQLLSGLLTKRAEQSSALQERILRLESEHADAKSRLTRLYDAVEQGTLESDEATLKDRISVLRETMTKADVALTKARGDIEMKATISETTTESFAKRMREFMATGDIHHRKNVIRSAVSAIIISKDSIRIIGHKDKLERAVNGKETFSASVRSFVPKWRTQ